MDPNKALADLREGLAELGSDQPADAAIIADVIELFAGLDEWITKGGFLPSDWSRS